MANRKEPIAIGVDVGGTKVLAVALEAGGTVLEVAEHRSPPGVDGLSFALDRAVESLLDRLSSRSNDVVGLGIALPGLIDAQGLLSAAPNLAAPDTSFDARRELADPLLGAMADRTGRSIASFATAFDNDATAAAFGEASCGAARGVSDTVVITLGTGIGAGIISNGLLARGNRLYAGEMGHIVIEPDGPECVCGRHGCWELYASGSALSRHAVELLSRGPTASILSGLDRRAIKGEDVISAASRGDDLALEAIETLADWLALGLVNLVELLDPALIVLGGGLMQASEFVLEPTRRAFRRHARRVQQDRSDTIIAAKLESRAAAIGIALLAIKDQVGAPRSGS